MVIRRNWPPSKDSLESARVVVPLVMRWIDPGSVLDLGCKLGEWLSIFQEHGVRDVLGIDRMTRLDGPIIDRASFRIVDLASPFSLDRTFDLALCLEVAEHLTPRSAPDLVRQLTAAAPVVLFSAAMPGQGGHGHVNERPSTYWHGLFAKHEFTSIDCVRPLIWQDMRVAYWYRQNMFVYASREGLLRHQSLAAESERPRATDMELIHTSVLRNRTLRGKVAQRVPVPIAHAWTAARRALLRQ